MSFMRTLASVAVGFAAAKGLEQYQKMGGMAGMQDLLKQASGPGGTGSPMEALTRQMSQVAGQMGLGDAMQKMTGGGANPLAGLMETLGGSGRAMSEAGAAGLGGLVSAMQGAAAAGGKGADDMMSALFGGTPASVAMEENAKLMLAAMIMAAKADGEIDAAEREQILGQLGDVSEEERAFVRAEMEAPVDPQRLAARAGEAMAAQVYAASLMAVRVDTAAERDYLQRLAEALHLPAAARARVHQSMGVPLSA